MRTDLMFSLMQKRVMLSFLKWTTKPPDPCVIISGCKVKCLDTVVHLGHVLTDNVYEFNISKCIEDFNQQCNMFLADFKHVNSQVRNNLFQKYCTSFYGTQILPLFDVNIQSLYTAWRIAIRRVWRIPWTTHNNMLAHIAGVMDPEYWFAKRCIRFIKMAYTSNNNTVRTWMCRDKQRSGRGNLTGIEVKVVIHTYRAPRVSMGFHLLSSPSVVTSSGDTMSPGTHTFPKKHIKSIPKKLVINLQLTKEGSTKEGTTTYREEGWGHTPTFRTCPDI